MMEENRMRKRKIYTYHCPLKPFKATRRKDSANVTAHRIYGKSATSVIFKERSSLTLASLLISTSRRPTLVSG